MSWNYRVIKETKQYKGESHDVYSIKEVYYDDENKPHSWTKDSVRLDSFDSLTELEGTLEFITKCFKKTVLELKDGKLIETGKTLIDTSGS